ncbi:MAG: VOC family protein [Nitrospinota bacterium]
MIPLTHISHYALRVADVERSIRFYSNVVGIDLTERRSNGTAYMRRGPDHHVLALYPSNYREPLDPKMTGLLGLDHVAFAVPDRSAVNDAARILKDAGARLLGGPTEWDEPGGPYAARFTDPDGNRIEICTAMARVIGTEIPHVAKPTGFGHLILHVQDPSETVNFYTDVLGFRVSDWVADFFVFLRCNPDHHAVGLIDGPAPSMNHAGFEVADIEAVKNAADIAWKNGVKSFWGIGRHGPGHNLFVYYPDPDGNVIEIFAELDRIHDEENYRPQTWSPEEAACVWTNHITERFVKGVQSVGSAVNRLG